MREPPDRHVARTLSTPVFAVLLPDVGRPTLGTVKIIDFCPNQPEPTWAKYWISIETRDV
jgi:hypothetical protein